MCASELVKKIKLLGYPFLLCFPLFAFTGIARSAAFTHRTLLAGDTTVVSNCGTSATLSSYPVAGYSNLVWDDGSTSTTRTVTSSGDYWWQMTGNNIVVNGDFTAGNTGFTSNYTYKNPTVSCGPGCNILGPEDAYTVYTDPHAEHSNFTQFADHTGNTVGPRNMLIVNGAPNANETVWAQNITILPHTDYLFSVWVTSVNPTSPAVLQFSVDGSLLGIISLSPTLSDGTWQYFTTTWNSGTISGTVPIALVNQNLQANGNDFAVDDIKFSPYYRQDLQVTLNPIPVLALTPGHACGTYDLTQTIVGYDTTTYTYVFKDSSGNIISPTSPIISQSGTYTITEQNKVTGCTSLPQQATVTIDPAPQKPNISSL
jgi:hypothetical protein